MKTLIALCLSLFLSAPAGALDYTGTAALNWSSLSFSGIPVTRSTTEIPSTFFPGQDNDFGGPNVEGHGVQVFSSLPQSAFPNATMGFGTGYHTQWSTTEALNITIPDPTVPPPGFQLGTGSSIADATHLTASVHMEGPGFIDAVINRNQWFRAEQAGNLTISIGYSLTHVGVPSLQSSFASTGTAALSFHFLDGTEVSSLATLTSAAGSGAQTGTLSLTHLFQAGDISTYFASAEMHTTSTQSVPIPGMFWPTLAGFVGLAGLVAWRRNIKTPTER